MKKILILITPVVLILLVVTGVVNFNNLKRNLSTLPARSAQFVRETASDTADALARQFPSIFGRN